MISQSMQDFFCGIINDLDGTGTVFLRSNASATATDNQFSIGTEVDAVDRARMPG